MALRYATPEEQLEQAGSVMAPQKSGYQKVLDFLVGGTPPERLAGLGGFGALKIVKPANVLAEGAGETINQAVRGLGREYIQYMRNLIRRGAAQPTRYNVHPNFPTGTYLRESRGGEKPPIEEIVQQALPAGERHPAGMRPVVILQHELTHGKYYNLPVRLRDLARKELSEIAPVTPTPRRAWTRADLASVGRGARLRGYAENMSPEEAFAMTGEGARAGSTAPLAEPYQEAGESLHRILRGYLRSMMRRAPESIAP